MAAVVKQKAHKQGLVDRALVFSDDCVSFEEFLDPRRWRQVRFRAVF
jgi:hypothetical protein